GTATVQAGSGTDYVFFSPNVTSLELDGGTGQSTYEVDGTNVQLKVDVDKSTLLVVNGSSVQRITKDTFSRFLIQGLAGAGTITLGPLGSLTVPGLIAEAGAGNKTLDASALTQAVTLVGGSGNDTLIAGGGPNFLQGGPGDSVLRNWKPGDAVLGGGGNTQ